jgi:Mrp family chromosome partitioning ATPase
MSRINQALSRAEGNPIREERPNAFTLQDYPDEGPGAADDLLESLSPPGEPRTALPPSRPVTADLNRAVDPLLAPHCRRILGVLHERRGERGWKTVAVTSAMETADKTRAAVNLALSLTRTPGSHVLLVDVEVRQPFVSELLGVPSETIQKASGRVQSDVQLIAPSPLLDVLTIGSRSSEGLTDLLDTRLPPLLQECGPRYNWVVVNGPAMSDVTGTGALARLTEGVVFVIGPSTPFPMVEQAIADVGRDRIVGTILIGI